MPQKLATSAGSAKANNLERIACDIRRLQDGLRLVAKKLTRDAIEIGRLLAQARDAMKAQGKRAFGFKAWLRDECEMSASCAYRYIALSRSAADDPELAELPLVEAYEKAGLIVNLARDEDHDPTQESRGEGEVVPVFDPCCTAPKVVDGKCWLSRKNWRGELLALLSDERSFEKMLRDGIVLKIKDADKKQ